MTGVAHGVVPNLIARSAEACFSNALMRRAAPSSECRLTEHEAPDCGEISKNRSKAQACMQVDVCRAGSTLKVPSTADRSCQAVGVMLLGSGTMIMFMSSSTMIVIGGMGTSPGTIVIF